MIYRCGLGDVFAHLAKHGDAIALVMAAVKAAKEKK